MADKHIEMNIDDALIEKPYCFTLETEGKGERHFYLFPVTLGKLHLLKRHMENLQINFQNLQLRSYLETLRIVTGRKEEVCRILAYHTFKKKRDMFDYPLVEERTKLFMENATNEELATVLIYILTKDNVEEYKKHLGIIKENERMRQVAEAKRRAQKNQNDFSFGCKTIYGTLIDAACERYGWSYDYVLWGISLTNLQLMLSDRLQNIYLTDEEKKKVPSRLLNDQNTINADDKANMDKILSMDWK